ncbi:MAG: esterase [Candidatus Latescibacterota bacterium]
MNRFLTVASALLCMAIIFPLSASGQLQQPASSPAVNADRTVTFRLSAPQADSVSLSASFLPNPQPMQKGADGVWSITTRPLAPEIYFYSFVVNGVRMLDPQNPMIHLSVAPGSSLLLVPGNTPAFYEEKNVPRGRVSYHRHHSTTFSDDRGYCVYTPPDYDRNQDARYPVLYLLHGYTDTEETWRVTGRANVILDNLIAEKKATPMIVVMPYGYATPRPGDGDGEWSAWFGRVTPRWESYLVRELLPLIEKEYQVKPGGENRAIAGLSMGGGQSVYCGMNNLGTFGYIGAFSSAVYQEVHGGLANDSEAVNKSLRLFWIGCGTEDFLYENNTGMISILKERGIRHTAHITGGAHEWRLWREYLRDFAPLLFR